ncbi:MAG TPA: amino acid ABC transporter permease [Jiangellaceae bacterium]|nr:amino acid ABC transporter permease [Jiangellaceae bacterium]
MRDTTTPKRKLSPRRRAQRIRLVQYAILVALVVLAALAADWAQIVDVFFRPSLISRAITSGIFNALVNTLVYTAGGFVLGLIAGTILALMKLSQVGPYRWMATAYIEFFRGLPAIIIFIAFSLLPLAIPGLRIPFPPYGTAWLALGIVASAYTAETVRAGIQAVPRGQVEAARSLGMTPFQANRKIVLPQAFRIVLPPLTNELILLVKDSSLIYIVGLTIAASELTTFGRQLANTTANLTPLVVAGFCYLLITVPLSAIVRRMEASAAKAR